MIKLAGEVDRGVVFAADNGSKKYGLGKTVKVKGGKNVKTKVSAEGIEGGLADAITAGGVKISSNGVDMNGTKVTNLAQGEVGETSTDAITGAQLHEVKQAVSRNDSRITDNTRRINGLEGSMDRVEKSEES